MEESYVSYVYSYNAINDVHVIRGGCNMLFSLYPMRLGPISRGLLEEVREDHKKECPFDASDLKISFSKDGYYAIVSFHGRTFNDEEIKQIIAGRFIYSAYDEDSQKSGEQPMQKTLKKPNE